MKSLHLIGLLALSSIARGQETIALHLWTDPQQHGTAHATFIGPGLVGELPFPLQGKVSSLEVGAGYTATLYDREDAGSHQGLVLIGPCRVDDLETMPRLALRGNWDDVVASVRIERTVRTDLQEPALAKE